MLRICKYICRGRLGKIGGLAAGTQRTYMLKTYQFLLIFTCVKIHISSAIVSTYIERPRLANNKQTTSNTSTPNPLPVNNLQRPKNATKKREKSPKFGSSGKCVGENENVETEKNSSGPQMLKFSPPAGKRSQI